MHTALYFPHTACTDKTILKNALFLFDTLEFIEPWKGYSKEHPPGDAHIAEALELIGKPIVPTQGEQSAAHKEIKQVCKGKVARKLNFRPSKKTGEYLIFPQKFHAKTWDLLTNKGLAQQLGEDVDLDYAMTRSLGHFMMAMLALSCSGGSKQLVTEYPDAFKALYLASSDEVRKNASHLDDVQHRLLNVRTKSFDFSSIHFSRLLKLRSKEDSLLRDLRRNYLESYRECLVEIESLSNNPREIESCVDRFTEKAEDDLKELKRALGRNAATTLLSKTIISTVAGVVSEALVPSTGFLASAGVLTGQLFGYQDKRRELLKNHSFAWLYEVGRTYKLY